ncbi:hypothetical protein GCM10028801_30000 [Nocardioides maradonensis]
MNPLLISAQALIVLVRGRAEQARRAGASQRGATAVEWAIISAIVVGLALVVAGVIRHVVTTRSAQIDQGTNG